MDSVDQAKKKEFMRFEKMCRYSGCMEEGTGVMLGILYCFKHLKKMDYEYEKSRR